MSTQQIAFSMGERAAIHGLDFNQIAGVVALGSTCSAEFEVWYQSFLAGSEYGRETLSKFIIKYKEIQ